MPNTEYSLGLGVKVLDANIQQQIDNISKKLKDIDIKIDSKDIEKLSVVFSEIQDSGKKLQTINAQLKNEQGQILKIAQNYDVETQEILNTTTRLLQVRKSETQQLKEQIKLSKLQSDKVVLDNRVAAYLKENTRLSDDLINRLINIQTQIKNADKLTLDRLKNEFREVTTEARALGRTGKSLKDELKEGFQKFTLWLGVGNVIVNTTRLIKNVVEEIRNIDSSMISLKKVTDETDVIYNKFLTNAAQKAKELGSSVSDLVESTADFARLGYNINDAAKLAEVATLYKNVGDGLTISDASSSIVSTMKAFNIAAEDSITIIDKFNEVGNNFAISSAGIGEALKRSASSLVEAGNTLDEAIALIVAANNVVQNPEAVGTMWKTVSMRIRGAKTELEEAGLEIDGMVESTAKLRDEIKALTGGFDIMIDENTFKSTYDIILGISEVYDKMSDIGQANLLELLAGKRQANALAAALNNVEDLQKALETSKQSAGSAMREQEKYTKSIEYSLDRLKASFQELSMVTVDSSTIKFFVDLLNGVVNLTTAMGGLGNVAVALGVTFISFKILLPLLVKQMSALAVAEGSAAFATMSQAVAQTGLNGAINLGTAAIMKNIAALKAWMTTSPVGLLLLITGSVVGLISILNSLEKSFEEIKQEWDELQFEINNVNNELETVGNRIDELLKKDALTIIEQDELERLKVTNTELERQNALLQKQQEFLKSDFAKGLYKKYLDEFAFDRVFGQVVSQDVGIVAFETTTKNIELARYEELEKKKRNNIELTKKEEKEYTNLGTKLSSTAIKLKELADEYPFDDEVKQNWLDMYNIINRVLNPALYKQEEFDKIFNSDNFKKVKAELLAFAEAGKLSPQILYYNKKYEELLRETGLTAHEAANYINSMVEEIEHGNSPTISFSETFENLNNVLDDLDKKSNDNISSIKELNQVLNDQAKGTKLTSEQAYKLITQYPQLATELEKTTDGYKINSDAINIVREALIEQEKANANAQLNMTKDTLNAVRDRVEAYGIELEAITNIQSAMSEQGNLMWMKIYGTMEGVSFDDINRRVTVGDKSFTWSKEIYDRIKVSYQEQKLIYDTIGKMGSLQERINGLQSSLLSDKGFGVSTKTTKKTTKEKEKDYIKEAFDLKKADIDHLLAMDKITQEEYYNRLEKLNNEYFGKNKKTHLENYRKYLEEVYKGRKQLQTDAIKAMFDDLKFKFDMDEIDEEEYYSTLREYNDKYYKGVERYQSEYRSNLVALHKWELEQLKKQLQAVMDEISKYDNIISEISHYSSLVDKDSIEYLTLQQTGYEQARQKAFRLSEEIDKLNKQYAKGKISEELYTEQLEKLTDQLFKASSSMKSYSDSIVSFMKARYDEQQKEIEETYKLELDNLEKTHKKTIESLNDQLKKYKEIVDEKKKALRIEKENYEYQKKIKEHTNNISKIEKRLIELSKAANSGDREAMAEKRKLEEELAKAKEALQETQYYREIDEAERVLDESYDQFEKIIKKKIDDTESLYETEKIQIQNNYEIRMNGIKEVYENEKKLILEAAELTQNAFSNAFASINSILVGYAITPSFDYKTAYVQTSGKYSSNSAITSIIGSGNNYGQNATGLSQLNQYLASRGYNIITKNDMVRLAQVLGLTDIKSVDDVQDTKEGRVNKNRILEALKNRGYSDGGTIGKLSHRTNLIDLVKLSGEDVLIPAKSGEGVLTKEQNKAWLQLVPNLTKLANIMNDYKHPNYSNLVPVKNDALSPTIKIEKLIEIQGNATPDIIPKLENISNSIANDVVNRIFKETRLL